MVELHLRVSDEHAAAVYGLLAELTGPDEPPAPAPSVLWTEALALAAIEHIVSAAEYELVRRMAEARGQRVPMSELSSAMGLPTVPDTSQDFAGLLAWCSADPDRPALPVSSGGGDSDGWYWMPIEACDRFLSAFRRRHGSG